MKQQFKDREDMDRMDEDDQDEDDDWEKISNKGKGDRMSGVLHTSTHDTDDGVFNSGFDV
jgi:protein-serine/threonine kinase